MVSSRAATVADYLAELPPERLPDIAAVRDVINSALPAGFVEGMSFGMIGWFVPLAEYPGTYNKQPLGLAALAAQKNYNALYLNCIYASSEAAERFRAAWAETGTRLDMGKSCIRYRSADDLPLDLIASEIASTGPAELIAIYEAARRR